MHNPTRMQSTHTDTMAMTATREQTLRESSRQRTENQPDVQTLARWCVDGGRRQSHFQPAFGRCELLGDDRRVVADELEACKKDGGAVLRDASHNFGLRQCRRRIEASRLARRFGHERKIAPEAARKRVANPHVDSSGGALHGYALQPATILVTADGQQARRAVKRQQRTRHLTQNVGQILRAAD